MTLNNMASKYRSNVQLLEARLKQVKLELSETAGLEKRRKLKQRIAVLHTLINESYTVIYTLEHYYDEEDESIERKCS